MALSKRSDRLSFNQLIEEADVDVDEHIISRSNRSSIRPGMAEFLDDDMLPEMSASTSR